MDSDDDDIFCYTPLQRSCTQLSQNSQLKQKQPGRLSLSQQVVKNKLKNQQNTAKRGSFKAPSITAKRKKSKSESSQKDATSVGLHTDVCPYCQMPWLALGIGGNRDVHIDKCSTIDYSSKKVCPKGLKCQEFDEKHYISYSHTLWAEARSQPVDLLNIESKMSPNDDSGFGSAAGPSGWKQRTENVNNASGDACSSSSSEKSNNQMANSLKIFEIDDNNDDDNDDDESLPDFGDLVNRSKNDANSTPVASVKSRLSDKTILFTSNILPNAKLNTTSEMNTPSQCDIQLFDDKEYSGDSEDTTLYEKTRVRREIDDSYITFKKKSLSSKENTTHYKNSAGEKNCVQRANISPRKTSSETNIHNNTQTTNTDESLSLLRDQNSEYDPVVDDQNQNDEEPRDDEDHQHPLDEELDPGEYDILNKLVDDAVDRFLQKENLNTKCFHLHLHYHESQQKSPGKTGQQSILNYFRPLNSTEASGEGTSNSQCCTSGFDEPNRSETRVSGAGAWKTLMAKMQGQKKLSKSENNTLAAQGQSKQWQLNKQNNFYSGAKRPCPFYKYIPDTNFVVDAFCYGYLNGISGYFLSHFHYDHFRGLTSKFNKLIFCSHITAKLVIMRVRVPSQYVRPLPMDEPRVIDGVEVTLLDANHCPGSVMFLFKLPSGSTVLHVGDFRAHPRMESYPSLWNCSIDTLYLDTTYCRPIYDFPGQEEVVEKCVSIATMHVEDNDKALIVIGSYTIGKERVFRAIAMALNCRIWANNDKQKILRSLEDEEIISRLTSDKSSARVHVVPMATIHQKKLIDYIEQLKPKFNVVVGIRPTGWEHNGDEMEVLDKLVPKQCGSVYIYGIPYSEHSSYKELQRFVKFTRPKKIIPTVNVGNENARKAMEREFKTWLQ